MHSPEQFFPAFAGERANHPAQPKKSWRLDGWFIARELS